LFTLYNDYVHKIKEILFKSGAQFSIEITSLILIVKKFYGIKLHFINMFPR